MAERYDIVIIGAGPAGYVGAIRAAQLGAKVVIFEKGELGGVCMNVGCIPTKTLVASAEILSKIKRSSEFGIDVGGEVKLNFEAMVKRVRRVVEINRGGIRSLLEKNRINLVEGEATIVGKRKIRVRRKDSLTVGPAEEIFESERILIATGSKPMDFAAFPFDGKAVLSSDDFFSMSQVPDSILIIGAGAIGCEFAFILSEFGCRITIVEMMERALPHEDSEISKVLEREMKKRKIALKTAAKVEGIEKEKDGRIAAIFSDGSRMVSEKILVSIGREFNSKGIGLENLNIKIRDNGSVVVGEGFETSVPGIYAAGDIIGKLMLAHVASAEAIAAVENSLGKNSTLEYESIPWGIFTSPEIGRVGLTEEEALKRGIETKTGRFNFRVLGKAHAMGEIEGFVKIIADGKDDRVIGVHIIGPHATDLIHEAALAVRWKMTASQVASLIHTHPTLSEAVMEAAHDVHGIAIHNPPG
ncbi:MAG: dihydrolipoyl dehydrogenase [Acidobacteriota bacterium]